MSLSDEPSEREPDFEPTKRDWRSFYSLLLMQTQNAFNDKAVQFLLVCTAGALVQLGIEEGGLTEQIPYLLGGIIVTPFILFSPLAGWIGDRFPKSTIIKFSAFFQGFVFLLLMGAMYLKSVELLVGCFFLLAIQSAILSPSKLGIIKELVGKRKLGFASGMLEMFTILGILGGTIIMSHWYGARLGSGMDPWEALRFPMYVLLTCTPVAILGALMIQKTEAKRSTSFRPSLLIEHFQQVGSLLKRRELRLSALGITYFWIFGGFLQLLSIQVAKEQSGGSSAGVGPDIANMMLVAGVGIALGSVVASVISKRRIELGLVPVGGLIMVVSCFAMAGCTPLSLNFMTWMFISGIGSAFFLVPVNAYLQDSCEESERGNIIAANNLLNCIGGILAVAAQGVMYKKFEFSVTSQFILLGVTSFAATLYATKLLPQQVVKFVALMLVRIVYRIRIEQDTRMPKEGGVLLVPNHVSYLDAFIISAASPRPVRFLMFDEYFKKSWMVWFLKLFNTVPISRTKAKKAIQVAADAVAAGDVVCIFPEGQLTRTGTINEVKRGFEMIARKANCPVQPVYMDGLWGSIFSFERGKFIYKKPYRLQYGVTVVFGEPIAAREAHHEKVRASLLDLGAEAIAMRDSLLKASTLSKHSAKVLEGTEGIVKEAEASFSKASEVQQKIWTLNALQLADGPALLRGSVIAIDATACQEVKEVLLHTLPLINRNKLVIIDPFAPAHELARIADCYPISVWIGGAALAEAVKAATTEAIIYTLNDDSESNTFPWWTEQGRVVAINMPDPNAETATQQHQPGTKAGSQGRLLPGYSIVNGAIHEACSEQTIPLEGKSIDPVGFISQTR